MKMYFDKFSEIGSSHKENEDFAVVGDEEHPFIIVSDGCSGSENTSTGSRLLSLCAAKFFKEFNLGCFLNANDIGDITIKLASSVVDLLRLKQECLDATLLVAYPYDNFMSVIIWGDGSVLYKHKNRGPEFLRVEYGAETPYYLSYQLNLENDNRYKDLAKEGRITKLEIDCEGNFPTSAILPTQLSILKEELEYVILLTDGMSSFINKNNKPVDQNMINDNIIAFKRLNGQFIGRRMNRMMKDFKREGITHYDDFTVAGISFVG